MLSLKSLKNNHAIHGLGFGVLTTVALKNRTPNATMIGVGVGLSLYYYMSMYGHALPDFSNRTDSEETNDTIYNNPRELMSTYSATI